jgi:carbon storage regulator
MRYADNLIDHQRLIERSPRRPSMLVLSRRKNESVVINDDITIVVVDIRGDKVRLGIEAPKEVPVHPREVYEAIRREADDGRVSRVRQQIEELKRQIRQLEVELGAP